MQAKVQFAGFGEQHSSCGHMHAERYNLRALVSREDPVGTCKHKGTNLGLRRAAKIQGARASKRYNLRALASSTAPVVICMQKGTTCGLWRAT